MNDYSQTEFNENETIDDNKSIHSNHSKELSNNNEIINKNENQLIKRKKSISEIIKTNINTINFDNKLNNIINNLLFDSINNATINTQLIITKKIRENICYQLSCDTITLQCDIAIQKLLLNYYSKNQKNHKKLNINNQINLNNKNELNLNEMNELNDSNAITD